MSTESDEFVQAMRTIMRADAAEVQEASSELTDVERDAMFTELAGDNGTIIYTYAAKLRPSVPDVGGRLEVQSATTKQYTTIDEFLADQAAGTIPNDLLCLNVDRNSWGYQRPLREQVESALKGQPSQPSIHLTKQQWNELVTFGDRVFGIVR